MPHTKRNRTATVGNSEYQGLSAIGFLLTSAWLMGSNGGYLTLTAIAEISMRALLTNAAA
jgi:hypothetical protein